MKLKEFSIDTMTEREIKEYLESSIYGKIPERPEHLTDNHTKEDIEFGGGCGIVRDFSLICIVEGSEISFPAKLVTPSRDGKYPTFIHIRYSNDNPARALPLEEIVDHGYAVMTICASNIVKIGDKERSLFEKRLCPSRKKGNAPGSLALYAWAATRAMEFVCTRPYIDGKCIIALGQGIMARAALLAAAFDERFSFVATVGHQYNYTNPGHISKKLFCPRFDGTISVGDELLYSLCKARHIMLCETADGYFTDRDAEFKALLSLKALSCDMPSEPCDILGENLFYRYRTGSDVLCRKDMLSFMDYIDKVRKM